MTRVFPLLRRRLLWEDLVSCTQSSASHSLILPQRSTTANSFKRRSISLLLLLLLFSTDSLILTSTTASVIGPTWHAFHGAAIIGTSMVIFGGITDPNVNPYSSNMLGSSDLWIWSTTLRTWSQPTSQFITGNTTNTSTTVPASPSPQKFLSSIPLQSQGKMLAYASNSSTGSTQGDLLVLDTNFWIWSIPASPNSAVAPQSRLGAAVGVSNNIIFIHGGAEVPNSDGLASATALNDLTKLDGSTFEWTSIANGPSLMYHTMCKVPGLNLMIIFGGSDSSNITYSAVHTFDLGQETWSLNRPVNAGVGGAIPSARKGHTSVCLNNTMIVYGGGADQPLDDDVWVLDASASQWVWNRITTNSQVGPGPRTGHSALLNETNMLVWGGYGSPQASDTNIYILDTVAWQWSSSKDLGPTSALPAAPAPNGPGKNNMPMIVGVICGCLVLIAAFIGFVVVKRRGSRKSQSKPMRSPADNHSYLSDAERHLSGDIDLDDKPHYYHHSGRDSGSSLGGWPAIATRRSIPTSPEGYHMRSMTTFSQQATTEVGSTNEHDDNNKIAREASVRDGQQQERISKEISKKDFDQTSQRTRDEASFTSGPYYPSHLAENDEEDADRWTFASSLSFDQKEKAGSIPTLRYIPSRSSGAVGIPRSMVHSNGSLAPSYSVSRGARRDASTSSVFSGQGSVPPSPSIAALGTSVGSQTLSRDSSVNPRDTTLFNTVSPLDRVSLMCSGLEVESQISGDDDGLTTKYLSPKSRFPQWRDSLKHDSFIEATVDEEEEEEEARATHNRTGSMSTTESSTTPVTLDHPALSNLVQNLPARYVVSKSPSPIHGTENDILFAVDSDTQQPIVIKSFNRKEAWERECRALRRLRGPCVVELKHVATLVLSESHEQNNSSKVRLIILERLDETLAQMLKNARKAMKVALREQVATSRSIDEAKALDLSGAALYSSGPALDENYVKDIVKGVLRCITWCHSKKIVYCDLKPTNIMHNRDDPRRQWKLIDMESSRTAGEERISIGTVRYCPPEVAIGIRSSAATSPTTTGVTAQYSMDLWAFGCLLYELFATRPLIPLSASNDEVLQFLANPSPDTPKLSNGLQWNSSLELEIPYFEQAVRDNSARQLIRMLLHPDPDSRATMDQVLNSEYLN